MRLAVHVRPRSSRIAVGGTHDGALVVRVTEPAERGRATEAALRAVADALAVPRRSVRLAHGSTGRRKVLEVDVADPTRPAVEALVMALRSGRP